VSQKLRRKCFHPFIRAKSSGKKLLPDSQADRAIKKAGINISEFRRVSIRVLPPSAFQASGSSSSENSSLEAGTDRYTEASLRRSAAAGVCALEVSVRRPTEGYRQPFKDLAIAQKIKLSPPRKLRGVCTSVNRCPATSIGKYPCASKLRKSAVAS